MYISQHDIAQLDDTTLKLLAIAADEAEQDDPRLAPLWRNFKHALIRAIRERTRTIAVLELDVLNDEIEEGELVDDTPAYDPDVWEPS